MARPRKNKGTAKAAAAAKAEPVVVEEVKAAPAAEEAKAESAPAAEEKKAEAKKPAAKSSAAKKTSKTATAAKTATKTATKTTEKPVSKTTEKAPAKKTTEEKRVVIQFAGNEISGAELVEKAKAVSGISNAKKIDIYVKPEDNKVYYVIDDNAGDFDLF